ncbi:MATE family efflux transporter [Paenibacillus apiarius]|uniref:Probable multidrug resistance protein NorM n=1 Tax=Paenibacillus apiarius TaxID=46240 RepID=A0ABT4DX21_9BACL|nr:MATE family efflux transporter [Paenibacillus apiarius]MCY9516806.1 MATE family efflux transporter [Paenibacillus apiarius]MCY9521899.1 MATE family efflux transporter [Paenibacillus apiarius]MCY9550445.1 MATE family efflux transporter [Paenibacillus apiarius]MCY9559906.1 MATE family efflux transporter [Paenibacillus apiarius]MCY9683410.1 MATE family efflux transporter [Paenibacillus apiarius]
MKNWKSILLLAIPSLLSFATQTVIGTINLIMVGHLGAIIIAIVGVVNIIIYNTFALFSGIGHTVNYMVAQNYGANEMKRGIRRTYIALYISMAVGGLLFLTGLFFSGNILYLTSGSKEIAEMGTYYLQLRIFAQSFGIVSFSLHGFLRGIGDTRTSMILSIVSNVTIVALVYVLTFGHFGFPELGLNGAGYAILIGEIVGFILALYVFFVRKHKQYNTRARVKVRLAELKELVSESFKLGMQEFSMSVSMFIFTMFVARLGTTALAANEIALNVMAFGFMPAFAFGSTATIMVGQEVGRGEPLRGRRVGTDVAVMGSIFILLLGAAEFIFAEPIAKLYNNTDPEVFHLAAVLIMTSAFLQLFDALYNFYAGALRGIGDTTFLMRASLVTSWLIFVPLAYVFIYVFDWGSIGAWMSLYLYLMVLGISLMVRFYRTDWGNIIIKQTVEGRKQENSLSV